MTTLKRTHIPHTISILKFTEFNTSFMTFTTIQALYTETTFETNMCSKRPVCNAAITVDKMKEIEISASLRINCVQKTSRHWMRF